MKCLVQSTEAIARGSPQRREKETWSNLRPPPSGQKAADVWKKDVWDFQVLSQTFIELRFALGNEGKDEPELPDLTWNSQASFSQTSATTRSGSLDATFPRALKNSKAL